MIEKGIQFFASVGEVSSTSINEKKSFNFSLGLNLQQMLLYSAHFVETSSIIIVALAIYSCARHMYNVVYDLRGIKAHVGISSSKQPR